VNLLVESVRLAGRAVPRRVMLGIYGFPKLARAVGGLLNAALSDRLNETIGCLRGAGCRVRPIGTGLEVASHFPVGGPSPVLALA
jgi:hypothetical protein